MRIIIPEIITTLEAETLVKLSGPRPVGHAFGRNSIVGKVTEIISQHVSLDLSPPSYYLIYFNTSGQKPHYDGCDGPGKPNGRSWCAYSATVLLSKGFKGGIFTFLTEPVESFHDEMFRSLLLFSSGPNNDPQRHGVAPQQSGPARHMLLMFFKEK